MSADPLLPGQVWAANLLNERALCGIRRESEPQACIGAWCGVRGSLGAVKNHCVLMNADDDDEANTDDELGGEGQVLG